MKIIIQACKEASVTINEQVHNEINQGMMVLVGFTHTDNETIIDKMIEKLINLRIYQDENQKMNLSLLDIKGEILSISQFTLYADAKKGRRPSYTNAANPEIASKQYDYFNEKIATRGVVVKAGIFGADMDIHLINSGPTTIILDSAEIL